MSIFEQHRVILEFFSKALPVLSIPLTYILHSTVLTSNSKSWAFFFYGRGTANSKTPDLVGELRDESYLHLKHLHPRQEKET